MSDRLTEEQLTLVEKNAPLAIFLARKRWELAPSILDYDELVSLAFQGLVSAAIRWRAYSEDNGLPEEDIAAGRGFSVYSRKRIIGSILDWQKKDADHVPRSYRTDYKLLQRAGYPERNRSASALSKITGLSEDRIRMVTAAVERSPVSFDEVLEAVDSDLIFEPASETNVESSLFVLSVCGAVANTVESLSKLQKVVVVLRYYKGLEIQEIASEIGVPVAEVRQSHGSALESIHAAMVAVAQQ